MSYQTKTDITLDVRKTNVQSVKAKQYDDETRILHFIVVDNDVQIDLTDNYRVNFKAYTPDARPILDTCEVLEDGTAQIVLNDNILFASGRMYAEIQLVNIYQETETDGVLSTMPFIVQIISSVYQDSEIESTEEFSTLVDALERVERLTVPMIFETYAQAKTAYDNGEIPLNTMVVIFNDEEVDNLDTQGQIIDDFKTI